MLPLVFIITEQTKRQAFILSMKKKYNLSRQKFIFSLRKKNEEHFGAMHLEETMHFCEQRALHVPIHS
jgi:hypothetical protein